LAGGGTVDALTWNALPDANLQQGSSGDVVRALQTRLKRRSGQWTTTPLGVDGDFGPQTKASVEAFQLWGGGAMDGIVGDQT
jgi:peptidoglycan hydrolase-like protein with peptidoglycan-binding domain